MNFAKPSALAILIAILLAGCGSEGLDTIAERPEINSHVPAGNANPTDDKRWRQIQNNEWYDLFERRLNETDSSICTAFRKVDAQRGITIPAEFAELAEERGFRYFTIEDEYLSNLQTAELAPLLPQDRVLVSVLRVRFTNVVPAEPRTRIFDVELFSPMTPIASPESEAEMSQTKGGR